MIKSPPPAGFFTVQSGLHYLSGTTAIAGNPDIVAPHRVVQLLSGRASPYLVAQTRSDAQGEWTFPALGFRQKTNGYTVIAYDLIRSGDTYDPAAKADLVPSLLPPDPAEHPEP